MHQCYRHDVVLNAIFSSKIASRMVAISQKQKIKMHHHHLCFITYITADVYSSGVRKNTHKPVFLRNYNYTDASVFCRRSKVTWRTLSSISTRPRTSRWSSTSHSAQSWPLRAGRATPSLTLTPRARRWPPCQSWGTGTWPPLATAAATPTAPLLCSPWATKTARWVDRNLNNKKKKWSVAEEDKTETEKGVNMCHADGKRIQESEPQTAHLQ